MTFSKPMLGTVQFGLNYGIANRTGQPNAGSVAEILIEAANRGINVLDTAAAYGVSESILGEVLTETKLQDQFEIITKTPPLPPDLPESDAFDFINTHLQESLRRLRRDSIAILLFHRESDLRYLSQMKRLLDKGIVRGIGVSLDSTEFLQQALDVQYVQLPCNLLDRRFDQFLRKASEKNMTVFARSAYLQGLLLMPEEEIQTSLADVIGYRRKLMALAEENDYDFKTFCIQFVLACPAVCSVVFGVDSVEQLRENLRAFQANPLSKDLFEKVVHLVPMLQENLIRPALWKR